MPPKPSVTGSKKQCTGAVLSRRAAQTGKALPNHHTGGAEGNHLPGASHQGTQPPHTPARPGPYGTPWGAQHSSPCALTLPAAEEIAMPG